MGKLIPERFTDANIKDLPLPEKGYKVHVEKLHKGYVPGFGVRTSPKGHEEFRFVLSYRNRAGTTRRYVIGRCNNWNATAARNEARELRRQIESGGDPAGDKKEKREAATVHDLFVEFQDEHLSTKRRATQRDYAGWYKKWIKPTLGSRKLEEVAYTDVRRLHRKLTKEGRATTANRVVAVLSSMFGFANREQIFADNPCRGIQRNDEEGRTDCLDSEEVVALSAVLDQYSEQDISNILRLLIFTGARSGETRAATWAQFDLERGVWTKPRTNTKTKKEHRVPLSAPARELLSRMRDEAEQDAVYLFPGNQDGHRGDMQRQWREICKAAGLVKTVDGRTVHKYRMHDLRHTYASTLASGGQSLPIIGALLGHTQAQTTQRYAHLLDDPLRQATESAGAVLSGKPKADVVPIKGAG